jgi:hypothetical protein
VYGTEIVLLLATLIALLPLLGKGGAANPGDDVRPEPSLPVNRAA